MNYNKKTYYTYINTLSIIVEFYESDQHIILDYITTIKNKTYKIPKSINLELVEILKIFHDKFVLELRLTNKSSQINAIMKNLLSNSFFVRKSIQNKNENLIEMQLKKENEKLERKVSNEYHKMFFGNNVTYYEIPHNVMHELNCLKREVYIVACDALIANFVKTDDIMTNTNNPKASKFSIQDRKNQFKEFLSLEKNHFEKMFIFYRDFIVPFKEKARDNGDVYLLNSFQFVENMVTFSECFYRKVDSVINQYKVEVCQTDIALDKVADDLFLLFKTTDLENFRKYLLKVDRCVSDINELNKTKFYITNFLDKNIESSIYLPIIRMMQYKSTLKDILASISDASILEKNKIIYSIIAKLIEHLNTIKMNQENQVISIKLQTAIKNFPMHIISSSNEFIRHLDFDNYTLFLMNEYLLITIRYTQSTDIQNLSTGKYKLGFLSRLDECNIFETNHKIYIIALIDKITKVLEFIKNEEVCSFFAILLNIKTRIIFNIKHKHDVIKQKHFKIYKDTASTNNYKSAGSVELKNINHAENQQKLLNAKKTYKIDLTAVFCSQIPTSSHFIIVNVKSKNDIKRYDERHTVFLIQDIELEVIYNENTYKYPNVEDFCKDLDFIIAQMLIYHNQDDKRLAKILIQHKILNTLEHSSPLKFSKECPIIQIKKNIETMQFRFRYRLIEKHKHMKDKSIKQQYCTISDDQIMKEIVSYFYKLVLSIFTSEDLERIGKDLCCIESKKYFFQYKVNEPFMDILQFLVDGYGLYKEVTCLSAIQNIFIGASKDVISDFIEKFKRRGNDKGYIGKSYL